VNKKSSQSDPCFLFVVKTVSRLTADWQSPLKTR